MVSVALGADRVALVACPIKKGLPSSPVVLLIVQRVAGVSVQETKKAGDRNEGVFCHRPALLDC